MIREKSAGTLPGGFMLLLLSVLVLFFGYNFIGAISQDADAVGIGFMIAAVVALVSMAGLTIVPPNDAIVVILFGSYIGTLNKQGFWWVNPFSSRKKISLKIRNFESGKLKVNDHDGNPIEIGAVIVWKVVDTAEAMFEVDDYVNYVHVQSESALRNLATTFPYDAHQDGQMSLRSHTIEVADKLQEEIQERLAQAGVKVIEARISHLAYAPEIASAMLQRQQASAIVAARTKIVEGAVGMVEMALDELSKKKVIELDEERKAAMVSNLLVVLCSDRHTQPVINTGTLHN